MKTFSKIYLTLYHIIERFLFALSFFLEFFLFLRLLFKFLGANPATLIVKILYQYSDLVISPFASIFPDLSVGGRMLEMATVTAMVGYGIALMILFGILSIFYRS